MEKDQLKRWKIADFLYHPQLPEMFDNKMEIIQSRRK